MLVSICLLLKFCLSPCLYLCLCDLNWKRDFVPSICILVDNDWYWTFIKSWIMELYLDYQESFHTVRFWLMVGSFFIDKIRYVPIKILPLDIFPFMKTLKLDTSSYYSIAFLYFSLNSNKLKSNLNHELIKIKNVLFRSLSNIYCALILPLPKTHIKCTNYKQIAFSLKKLHDLILV